MKITIFTSDTHSWLLKGFFHQWCKYGYKSTKGEEFEVEVAGFTRPEGLPPDVGFHSIGKFEKFPVGKWSDGIIKYLEGMQDELFLFLLEDYWLMRPINQMALSSAYGYMMTHKDTIRFDVASDRMFAHESRFVEPWGSVDICEGKGAYSLSFQASIFRKSLLLEVLRPGWSPWEAEIYGSGWLNKLPYRVVGSYQWPIMYMIVVNKGEFDRKGEWMYPSRTLAPDDWADLDILGYTSEKEVTREHPL